MAEIFIELSSTESPFGLFADLLCGVKSFGSKFQKESKGKGKKQKKKSQTHTQKNVCYFDVYIHTHTHIHINFRYSCSVYWQGLGVF